MTKNQIDYQNYLENQRSHLASETETGRANRAREVETNRANLASEALKKEQNVETKRSNLARELETNRANLAHERLTAERNANDLRASIYATDKRSQDAMYSADKGYQGRIDSAYINQYGISKSDVQDAAETVGGAIDKVARNPKLFKGAATIVLAPNVALKTPSGLAKALQNNVVKPILGGSNNGKTKTKTKRKR
nr:putative ORF1 [Marmot picobirnavirus]